MSVNWVKKGTAPSLSMDIEENQRRYWYLPFARKLCPLFSPTAFRALTICVVLKGAYSVLLILTASGTKRKYDFFLARDELLCMNTYTSVVLIH